MFRHAKRAHEGSSFMQHAEIEPSSSRPVEGRLQVEGVEERVDTAGVAAWPFVG